MNLKIKKLIILFKNSREIIHTSIITLNTLLSIYLIYRINKARTDMVDGISKVNTKVLNRLDQVNAQVINSLDEVNHQVINSLDSVNSKILNRLDSVNMQVLKSLDSVNSKIGTIDFDSLNIKLSENSNEVILRMLELQTKTAQSYSTPSITIIQESSSRPVVVGVLLLVAITVTGIWWFAPKVILMTTTQLGKINLVISELLRLMPGSNSAEATTFLNEFGIKVVTSINNGIPSHQVITSNNLTYGLEEFLSNLTICTTCAAKANAFNIIPDVVNVVTKSGIDISGLL